jgi:hypothetical protein
MTKKTDKWRSHCAQQPTPKLANPLLELAKQARREGNYLAADFIQQTHDEMKAARTKPAKQLVHVEVPIPRMRKVVRYTEHLCEGSGFDTQMTLMCALADVISRHANNPRGAAATTCEGLTQMVAAMSAKRAKPNPGNGRKNRTFV